MSIAVSVVIPTFRREALLDRCLAALVAQDFDPEDYSHYEDLTFGAYVTDLSTKRTEQRRFRIRLTERPIQLYVTSGDSWSEHDIDRFVYAKRQAAGLRSAGDADPRKLIR